MQNASIVDGVRFSILHHSFNMATVTYYFALKSAATWWVNTKRLCGSVSPVPDLRVSHLEGEDAEYCDAAVVQYVRDLVKSPGVLILASTTSKTSCVPLAL